MKHREHGRTRTLVLTALLTSLALVLGYVERMLPLDLAVPGIKLGLANVVVVCGLYLFPFRTAFALALLKSGTTFLINGSAVGFLYGLCGTLCSFLAMAALRRLLRDRISPVSVSAVGSMLHMVGQIGAAILVTKTPALIAYLPLLLIAGAITGTVVGLSVRGLLPYLRIHRA